MTTPSIELTDISKVYHVQPVETFKEPLKTRATDSNVGKIAVNHVNLKFNSGESIGLIGKNGAGKSTLLSIIAGIMSPSSGHLSIVGKVTTVMTLGVGLREDLTGRENIYIDGELQGKSRSEMNQVIDEIIEFSELGDFIDKPVKCYSSGMKSRLSFSMLVCIEPEILIIDEALSAGDAFFAQKASKKIKEICQLGKIVIIVSHSMGAILSLCNRCLWLDKGTVLMDGSPETVTQSYLLKVREEDTFIEVDRYQGNCANTLPNAKYKIKEIFLTSRDQNQLQQVFYTGDYFAIEIIIHAQELTEATIELTIERLDGLIVDTQTVRLHHSYFASPSSEAHITFYLDTLVLNKGFYNLNVELYEMKILTNQFSRSFEVKNTKMAQGGVPILHYPSEIKLKNENEILCSN